MADLYVNWLRITDSTNLDAFRHLETSPDKSVWAAEFQTAGRGQRGNVWNSECSENLTFSILLKPSGISAKEQFLISAAVSVAMVRYLGAKGISGRIKWPNDIYAGDGKICGILIEHRISGDKLSVSVVGVGLNVNQTVFPPELPNPTSMSLSSPDARRYDLKDELVGFLSVFYEIYDSLDGIPERDALYEEYHSLMYRRGEWHRFKEVSSEGARVISGCIEGIEKETSRLKLRTSSGTIRTYAFQEIRYIP